MNIGRALFAWAVLAAPVFAAPVERVSLSVERPVFSAVAGAAIIMGPAQMPSLAPAALSPGLLLPAAPDAAPVVHVPSFQAAMLAPSRPVVRAVPAASKPGSRSVELGASRPESRRAFALAQDIAERLDERRETEDAGTAASWGSMGRAAALARPRADGELLARPGPEAPIVVPARQRGGARLSLLAGIASLVGVALMACQSWGAVAWIPLPEAIPAWSQLVFGAWGWSAGWHWAWLALSGTVISVGISKLLGYDQSKDLGKTPNLRMSHLLFLLPYMAYLEELIFRVGLLMVLAKLLFWLTPLGAASAMIVSALLTSAKFAAAHGYGPKLPRFVTGLIFSYLFLTGGFMLAGLVHYLHNAILVVLSSLNERAEKV